jgi:hypothetical protein
MARTCPSADTSAVLVAKFLLSSTPATKAIHLTGQMNKDTASESSTFTPPLVPLRPCRRHHRPWEDDGDQDDGNEKIAPLPQTPNPIHQDLSAKLKVDEETDQLELDHRETKRKAHTHSPGGPHRRRRKTSTRVSRAASPPRQVDDDPVDPPHPLPGLPAWDSTPPPEPRAIEPESVLEWPGFPGMPTIATSAGTALVTGLTQPYFSTVLHYLSLAAFCPPLLPLLASSIASTCTYPVAPSEPDQPPESGDQLKKSAVVSPYVFTDETGKLTEAAKRTGSTNRESGELHRSRPGEPRATSREPTGEDASRGSWREKGGAFTFHNLSALEPSKRSGRLRLKWKRES